MDDADYVRTLETILTNPRPTGIDPDDPYGRADDGIDRYDGFGRDVLVKSLRVEGGEHGAQLVVEFGLALPRGRRWKRFPAEGIVRLPFDREWRHLSGYDDPAAYAPEVASRVEMAAHRHVVLHRERGESFDARERRRSSLPSRDAQWQMLLDGLSSEGRLVEVEQGRVVVLMDGGDEESGQTVTVLVTPQEWEEALSIEGSADISELLCARDEDEMFVVFDDGRLVCSTRAQLPPVRGRALERQIAAADPEGRGSWSASPPPPEV